MVLAHTRPILIESVILMVYKKKYGASTYKVIYLFNKVKSYFNHNVWKIKVEPDT